MNMKTNNMTTAIVNENMSINDALEIARSEVKNPYALTYLNNIIPAIDDYGLRGFKVQILYALNNMAGWKGDTARTVKKLLKKYAMK